MSENLEEKKPIYKKWWFWLIMLGMAIVLGFTIIMLTAFNIVTSGINKVALEVQRIDNEATVYSSAGSNVVIVEIPNYTDDTKLAKKEKIEEVIKDNARKYEPLEDYSTAIICTKMNEDDSKDYFLSMTAYSLPDMTENEDLSGLYIDFIEYTRQTLSTTLSNTSQTEEKGEDITLTAGKYTVGTDIKAGKYDAIAKSSSGNFFVNGSTSVNEILSAKNDGFGIPKYSNLTLKNGDVVEIKGGLSVKLQAK